MLLLAIIVVGSVNAPVARACCKFKRTDESRIFQLLQIYVEVIKINKFIFNVNLHNNFFCITIMKFKKIRLEQIVFNWVLAV